MTSAAPRRLGWLNRRQLDADHEAASVIVATAYATTHLLHQAAHQGEADPGAAALAGELVLTAIERLEDLLEVTRRNPRTVVRHIERHTATLGAAGDHHLLGGGATRVLDGIVDEVEENLVEGIAVEASSGKKPVATPIAALQ